MKEKEPMIKLEDNSPYENQQYIDTYNDHLGNKNTLDVDRGIANSEQKQASFYFTGN